MSAGISVVVVTRDEERNLPYALRSAAPWAAEIVVVDMHSGDRTREIAEAAGARVFLHEPVGYVEPARAFAVSRCRHEWVLVLDADELVTAPLARRLRAVAATDEADAVEIPRANWLVGRRMTHTGWGPHQDHQLRFFKRAKVVFSDRIHAKPRPAPGARVLRLSTGNGEELAHFSYLDLEQFLEKLNRYTSIEARGLPSAGGVPGALAAALRRFAGKYVRRGGWRDGWHGLVLSVYQAFYEFASRTKRMQAERVGSRSDIDASYREAAERILAELEGTPGERGPNVASRADSASASSSQSM